MSDRVLAIVVSYNPQIEELSRALQAICNQVQGIIVIDNASQNVAELSACLDQIRHTRGSIAQDKVWFLPQTENLGLGAAHNIGIEWAREQSFNAVLILDQDSVPMNGMVAKLLSASKAKQASAVSAVGAVYLNAENNSQSFFVRFGLLKFKRIYCAQNNEGTEGCVEADFLISSGSLISLAALNVIGDMDESLFIDHVDTEWFLRAKSMGYKAYGVCGAAMQHALGEKTHRMRLSVSGRQRNVPQHKPFRYYYIFRNSVLLYKRSYCSGLWKWNDLQRLSMIFVMFGLLKAPRWQNMKMMLKGVYDGLRGVTGSVKRLTETNINADQSGKERQ